MLVTTIEAPYQANAIVQKVQSGQPKKILNALRSTIILNSQGVQTNHLNPTIIKEVIEYFSINSTNKKVNVELLNSIRKAFYLFLELIPKTDGNGKIFAEFFLLTNQIRKDLEHPNEFFRAIVMNTLSKIIEVDEKNKLALQECFEPLNGPILKNIKHMHFYTRRNALIAYFNGFDPETDLIFDTMQRENNSQVLRLCYNMLKIIQKNGNIAEFTSEGEINLGPVSYTLKTIPEDLLADILKSTKSKELIFECISMKKCRSFAYFVLLRNFESFPSNLIPQFLEILNDPIFKEIGLKSIWNNLHKICANLNVSQIIHLLDPDCKEILFKIISSIQKPIDREIIKKKLLEEISVDFYDEDYLVFLLERYTEFASDSTDKSVQRKLKTLVVGQNPRIAYAALPLCDNLLVILPSIKFGRVFRRAVNLILNNEADYQKFVEMCQKDDFLLNQINNYSVVAMALFKIAFLTQKKDQILEILIKMLETGKNDINFDFTTFEIITQVYNDVSTRDLKVAEEPQKSEQIYENKKEMCFPYFKQSKKRTSAPETETKRMVKQLSGYTDPLYVEAFVNFTRLKISVELLIINTTSHMITNIIPEFTVSSNISGDRSYGFNLDKQSMIKKEYSFKVNEVVNGFLTGYMQFSIGKNMNMSISLGEIQFKVNEYLLEKNISQDDFKGSWLTLEWENSYTSRFRSSLSIDKVFDRIKSDLKCSIIDQIQYLHQNFIVANLCCTTLLAEDILLNLKISKEKSAFVVDCRMRSASEQIVKSLSVVFGECLRGIKE